MPLTEPTKGSLLVMAAAAGFGTLAIFGKLAAIAGLPVATLLLFRFLVGTVLVWAFFGYRRRLRRIAGRSLGIALALGGLYGLMTGLFFWGLDYLSAGLAAIVFYTYPVHVFVLSTLLLDEPLTRQRLVALVAAVAGVGLIVGVDSSGGDPFGIALVLASAIGYATYTAGSRAVLPTVDSSPFIGTVLVGATAITLPFGLAFGGLSVPSGIDQWLVVVGIGVVGTAVPIVLFLQGLERIEASRASIIGTSEPVVTVFLGSLVLDERVTPIVLLGGALVLLGVLLIQRAGRPTGMVVH